MDYFIKTSMIESDCLVLPFEEYVALRNVIIQHLFTVYERVDYKDADWRHYEIILVGTVGYHRCTYCFHAQEWIDHYRENTLDLEIIKRLDWGRKQIERIGEMKTPLKRMSVKEPVTPTTVFRSGVC